MCITNVLWELKKEGNYLSDILFFKICKFEDNALTEAQSWDFWSKKFSLGVSVCFLDPPILRDSLSAQFLPPNSVNLTWIAAKSEHAMDTWYLVWYHTKVKFSFINGEGRGYESAKVFSSRMGDLSELGLVTKLQHNYTDTFAVVPRLQPGNFYHLYVQACNDAGCSRSINRVFDFEPSNTNVASR